MGNTPRKCGPDHHNRGEQDPVHRPGQDVVKQNDQEHPCSTPSDHSSAPVPPEELDPDHNTTIWVEEADTNTTVPQPHARVLDHPGEEDARLPDIETQQITPGVADQQSMSPQDKPQVPLQVMPTTPDNKPESLPDKAEEEADEVRGEVEHTDDATADPDFVPTENTQLGDNQVRQTARKRKPKVFKDFVTY